MAMEQAIRRMVQDILEQQEIKVIFEEILSRKYAFQPSFFNKARDMPCLIRIDNKCRIILVNYGERVLPLSGYQAKTLYVFYLISPCGIANHNLEKFRDIFMELYKNICDYKMSDYKRAQECVDGILKRKAGLWEANCKIRKALKTVIGNKEELNSYMIYGDRKNKRAIPLDKGLIRIENDKINEIRTKLLERIIEQNNY